MGSLAPCLTPTYNLGLLWPLPSSHPCQSCLVRIWSSHSSTLFFLDHDVSGKLPTYPSPKRTFCPKWEVSAYVGLGEHRGRWAVSHASAFKLIVCGRRDSTSKLPIFAIHSCGLDGGMYAYVGLVVNTSNSGSGGLGFKPHPLHCFLRQGTLLHFVSLHPGV